MAAVYKLLNATGTVIRTADNATIAFDPLDPDYMAYLTWLAAGNIPDATPPPLNQSDNTFGSDPWQALS
jgi:hypothetical protein